MSAANVVGCFYEAILLGRLVLMDSRYQRLSLDWNVDRHCGFPTNSHLTMY